MADEVARIAEVYARRQALPGDRYSLFRSGNLYRVQRLERGLLECLSREGFEDLSERTVLDVGCGTGDRLRLMLRYGVRPEHAVGVDVLDERLAIARSLSPHLRFELIDGRHLPFPDGSFDVVMQETVFSSILDPELQRILADEMRRVLKPGGIVLWYDMRVTDPRNPDLTPLTRERIQTLFPGASLHLRSHTLLPPLSRRLAPLSWTLCRFLEAFPPLRGHYLGAIRPKG